MNSSTLPENTRVLVVDDTSGIHEDFDKILSVNSDTSMLDDLEASLFQTRNAPQSAPRHQLKFELQHAFQGNEALEAVMRAKQKQLPFAVAFVDMRMPPGWDGVETIERLWEVDPDLEVVICTAYSDYSWDEALERLGLNDKLLILKKPFEAIEVKQLATALVTKWNSGRLAQLNAQQLSSMVKERTAEIEQQKQSLVKLIQLLQETRNKLIQSEKFSAIGQLAAGMAHEINNPLSFIRSNLGELKDYGTALLKMIEQAHQAHLKESDTHAELIALYRELDISFIQHNYQDALSSCVKGSERVSAIINDLKVFADQGESKVKIKLVPLLQEAVSQVLARQGDGQSCSQSFAEVPDIYGYPDKLQQAFVHLLNNAFDATRKQGDVSLACYREGEVVKVDVSDSGRGIHEALMSRIWEPFFTTKPVGQGTGLGLHVCKSIVETHGGEIHVSSEEGQGCVFSVSLPIEGDEN